MSEEDNADNNSVGGADVVSINAITLSQETLISLLTSIQQIQNKFCQQLIREVRSSTSQANTLKRLFTVALAVFGVAVGNSTLLLSVNAGFNRSSLISVYCFSALSAA